MAGLYIHIPFCASRCIYCGFYSTVRLELRQRYVDALCREMTMRRDANGQQPTENIPYNLTTIYMGGGTPSQLTGDQLWQLFQHINKVYAPTPSSLKEVTIECNPDDITAAYAETLAQLPVNRVSMGVQTFADERLRFLHRRHTAAEVPVAVRRLRDAGIRNISIDLMFGFPGETLDDWQRDIEAAIALGVEHISAYSLMYEEGTPLYEMVEERREERGERREDSGKRREERGERREERDMGVRRVPFIEPISDELSRQMYELLIDRLTAAGYEQYEISNFALPGCRSLHNSSYWNGTPYIGIGAAAHSYDGHSRQWNVSDINRYIDGIGRGERPFDGEVLDDDTRYNDLITTALRTREGIFLPSLETKYRNYLLENAQPALARGFLTIDGDCIHLTRSGLFISDDVMSDLIMA